MVFPSVAGSKKPPRYSLQEVSPMKMLIKTYVEPTTQCTSPAAGMRKTDPKMKNIWEVVSREATTSQATSATSQPPNTPLKVIYQG